MPTTVNAPVLTIAMSFPQISVPQHVYAPTITIPMYFPGVYIPPTPTPVPTGTTVAPVLQQNIAMPAPTIVNGRPQ